MSQPQWELVAQLGDATPIEYGGYWIFKDATGVYPAEGEFLLIDEESGRGTVYRYSLDKCTFIGGVLSDNYYHPDAPAWFADSLDKIADCNGIQPGALIALLCSDDIQERAIGWRNIGDYHGFDNLDSYPLDLSRKELKERYKNPQYKEGK